MRICAFLQLWCCWRIVSLDCVHALPCTNLFICFDGGPSRTKRRFYCAKLSESIWLSTFRSVLSNNLESTSPDNVNQHWWFLFCQLIEWWPDPSFRDTEYFATYRSVQVENEHIEGQLATIQELNAISYREREIQWPQRVPGMKYAISMGNLVSCFISSKSTLGESNGYERNDLCGSPFFNSYYTTVTPTLIGAILNIILLSSSVGSSCVSSGTRPAVHFDKFTFWGRSMQEISSPGKALGSDGLLSTLFKYGGMLYGEELRALFSHVWYSQQVPCPWSKSIVIPMIKKDSDSDWY